MSAPKLLQIGNSVGAIPPKHARSTWRCMASPIPAISTPFPLAQWLREHITRR